MINSIHNRDKVGFALHIRPNRLAVRDLSKWCICRRQRFLERKRWFVFRFVRCRFYFPFILLGFSISSLFACFCSAIHSLHLKITKILLLCLFCVYVRFCLFLYLALCSFQLLFASLPLFRPVQMLSLFYILRLLITFNAGTWIVFPRNQLTNKTKMYFCTK